MGAYYLGQSSHNSRIKSNPQGFKTNLRYFAFNWAFVDPSIPIEKGLKFRVCAKEVLPWLEIPLQVAYVTDIKNSDRRSSRHLLGLAVRGKTRASTCPHLRARASKAGVPKIHQS